MRSYTVFEDFSRGRSRWKRPGYWQNRGGFAGSPHFLPTHDSNPPVRSRTPKKTAESVLILIRIVSRRDDLSGGVGPHLGARRKLGTTIGPDFKAWTKVQPYTASLWLRLRRGRKYAG